MAIINTLQKCLDSPYLFEDKEAPNRIVDLLAKAGDRLEAAVNIHTAARAIRPTSSSSATRRCSVACGHWSTPRDIANSACAA